MQFFFIFSYGFRSKVIMVRVLYIIGGDTHVAKVLGFCNFLNVAYVVPGTNAHVSDMTVTRPVLSHSW